MADKKPDLSEFFKHSRPKKPPCKIGFLIDQQELSPEEVEQLQAACDQDKGLITGGAIQKWLAERGHDTSIPAITAHRTKVCTCFVEKT